MLFNQDRETKKNWLKWAMNFVNTDLGSINGEEKFYLVYILNTLFYPFRDPQDVRKSAFNERLADQFRFEITDEIWEKASSIQTGFKDFFNDLINRREEIRPLKNDQKGNKPFHIKRMWQLAMRFSPFFVLFTDASTHSGFIPLDFELDYMEGRFFKKNDRNDSAVREFEDFPLEILKEGKLSSLSWTFYLAWLFWILDGIPIQWIRKCKGCDRFFLNPTERDKIFCNSSCASRSIARLKREEMRKDPEKYRAYLEKQKKIMKKRYKLMRKAQLGTNVKVGRKLTKKKED